MLSGEKQKCIAGQALHFYIIFRKQSHKIHCMKKRIFVVTAAIISSLPTPAFAQQDSIIRSLDEALVTANKFPSKTSLTGKVVTIISKEEIDRSSARDLSQLLAIHSGMIVAGSNGSPGKDKTIFLRGAVAEYTLIMIDGTPVSDPSGIGGHFDIRNISLSNVERIEIVKGSQSTLYGSSAIAGVINIITRKTTNKKSVFEGMVTAGSNETYKLHTGIRGKLDKLNYFANYSFHSSRGINDAMESPGISPGDRDGYKQHAIELGLGLQINQNIRIQPFARFAFHQGDIDDGAFADELDFTYEQESLQIGFSSETILGKNRLHLNYSYGFIDRIYIDDSTKSRFGFDIFSEGLYKGNEHFVDAYIHVPFGTKWKWTLGADTRFTESDQSYYTLGGFPYSTKYSGDSLHQRQLAIYSALNLNNPSGFNFEVGGRLNFHSEYGMEPVYNLNPSYFFNKQWKVFANLSSGYRTPTVYQLFSEFGNRDLKPESSLSFEMGLQYFSQNNKWTSRAVYFRRRVNDILFFFTDPNTFKSQYINQDQQNDHGFEWEARAIISQNFSVRAYYNYLDGEIDTRVGGRDTSYNNLIRRPKHHFGISGTADIGKRFSLSSNLSYVGEREDNYFDPFLYSIVKDNLDAYFLWDIYAELRFCRDRWKIFADLRNITDSKYTEISGFNTMGRNVYFGTRVEL
jgi:vitamin B12 transporter